MNLSLRVLLPPSQQVTDGILWDQVKRSFFAARMTETMSLVVDVSLISGKTVSVETRLDESVGTLKRRAQTALAVGTGRLLDSAARLLDEQQTVQEADLRNDTLLTLQLDQVQVRGTRSNAEEIAPDGAFAAILSDGSAVAWGSKHCGGDSGAMQDQLKGVQQIPASGHAFAATLSDGSVVTRGNEDYGGDSRAVQDQLKCVQQIQASERAFAAILSDGSIVTWGSKYCGCDSREVQDQLKCVQQIQASERAFAAILSDGSIVTWGSKYCGCDSREVQDQLKGVQQI